MNRQLPSVYPGEHRLRFRPQKLESNPHELLVRGGSVHRIGFLGKVRKRHFVDQRDVSNLDALHAANPEAWKFSGYNGSASQSIRPTSLWKVQRT